MKQFYLLIVVFLIIFSNCGKTDPPYSGYQYSQPLAFDYGIATGTLESVGMDSLPLLKMMNFLNSHSHNIHNILIVKDNKLVFEEYFGGYKLSYSAADYNGIKMEYDKNFDHPMQSISKSVCSVVFGIAVDEGYFPDLNKKIIGYFPEYADILADGKENVTIHHLLTMSSGIAWDESTYPIGDPRNDIGELFASADPIRYILSRPLLTAPGTEFAYSSGSTNVIAAIIEKATGMSFLDYANLKLFEPMRSEGGSWMGYTNGQTHASGGLYFKARELTKIGQLFLNDGQFEGKKIISPEWIEKTQHEFIVPDAPFFPDARYSYQWWLNSFVVNGTKYECFFAAGWGDQFMFIIPDLNLIVEWNSGNYTGASRIRPLELMSEYVLEAIK